MTRVQPPKVFISYSRDLPEDVQRVLELWKRLRADGIDCSIKQYLPPGTNLLSWTEQKIRESDFALIICTAGYVHKNNNFSRFTNEDFSEDVDYEFDFIREMPKVRIIPVIFSLADAEHIPEFLKRHVYANLDSEEGYRRLYSALTNQLVMAELPPIGDIIASPREPLEFGSIAVLELKNVLPGDGLRFESADHLNLISGDNGLGKTFLLECVWWALTGRWSGSPAYPSDHDGGAPEIHFGVQGETVCERNKIVYDRTTQVWGKRNINRITPGLLLYARVDGSFAVWDPARDDDRLKSSQSDAPERPAAFTREQIWDGLEIEHRGKRTSIINGLLHDWALWQSRPDKYPFETFQKVLERLSPPEQGDLGRLTPGELTRLPFDAREIPTIQHPYGEVPIIHASAAVRRVLTLAYLIVWTWHEHKINAELTRTPPQNRMVVMIDEIEAHLHPQWQRRILPALLGVGEELSAELRMQLMITTHSPLVLASVEPYFNSERDKLFHLDLVADGKSIALQELPFYKRGTADNWLTSDVFDLKSSRSVEAEAAIQKATQLQAQANPTQADVQAAHQELVNHLAEGDRFWVRWLAFAERHGVEI
jgi:hypothetical protein